MSGDFQRRRRAGSVRPRRVVFVVLIAVLVVQAAWLGRLGLIYLAQIHRTTEIFDPPVIAGRRVAEWCSGGVYAKTSDGRIVITTTGHCANAGDPMTTPEGRYVGTASAPSRFEPCDRPGKNRCTTSDMALVAMVPEMIPWGHLNWIDLGAGGYRVIEPGTRALSCADIRVGDGVEFNGRDLFRTGKVLEIGSNDFPADGTYIPCLVAASISVAGGDSGGVVLVRGLPAGVAARAFGADSTMGFSPLADGLAEMGLTMCDTPDCGLVPPASIGSAATATP